MGGLEHARISRYGDTIDKTISTPHGSVSAAEQYNPDDTVISEDHARLRLTAERVICAAPFRNYSTYSTTLVCLCNDQDSSSSSLCLCTAVQTRSLSLYRCSNKIRGPHPEDPGSSQSKSDFYANCHHRCQHGRAHGLLAPAKPRAPACRGYRLVMQTRHVHSALMGTIEDFTTTKELTYVVLRRIDFRVKGRN